MIPVSFGELAGFLHPADGDCGLVLCGAFGYEHLCAHAGWRGFADSLAAEGFPVLRFDWHGSGDSLGSDEDDGRLEAWRASLDQAIAFLKQSSGVTRIALVGLRLGALLAADAISRHPQLAALALLAPPASGRAYLRECRALAAVMAKATKEPAAATGFSFAGFHITQQTMEDVSKVDLAAVRPDMPVLVLAPDGQAGTERLVSQWRGAGAAVTLEPFAGYADYFANPTFGKVPFRAFAEVQRWLHETLTPSRGASTFSLRDVRSAVLDHPAFQEEAVGFGPDGRLFGVLCTPAAPQPHVPTLVLLNAGANPHSGWARMGVLHARSLAAQGIASLRIDLAGLGDSLPAPGRFEPPLYDRAAVEDVKAALDWLAARGRDRVVLAGLCSGAHAAFHAGAGDARVAGIVMANLQRFIWRPGDSLELASRAAGRPNSAYLRDALRLDTWQRVFRGEVATASIARTIGNRVAQTARKRLGETFSSFSAAGTTDVVQGGFAALARRDAHALLVYSRDDAGIDELSLHMGRGARRLARYAGTSVAFIEDADHNLTPPAARDEFLRLLADFIGSLQRKRHAA